MAAAASALSAAVALLCVSLPTAQGGLLCRHCGHVIVADGAQSAGDAVFDASDERATDTKWLRVLDTTTRLHSFANPAGETFEVLAVETADIAIQGRPSAVASWFKGFEWVVAVCRQCGQHLGWRFTRGKDVQQCDDGDSDAACGTLSRKSFVGLVLDYVIGEHYADTLTVVPRPR